jgi:hypothetical protein
MATRSWNLVRNRPAIEVALTAPGTGVLHPRMLLADTGAGSNTAPFDLLLDEEDCLLLSDRSGSIANLSGAYAGTFRVYIVHIRLEELDFSEEVKAVGIENPPRGFDGIAGFRFLNRFTYGNFGADDQFGLAIE